MLWRVIRDFVSVAAFAAAMLLVAGGATLAVTASGWRRCGPEVEEWSGSDIRIDLHGEGSLLVRFLDGGPPRDDALYFTRIVHESSGRVLGEGYVDAAARYGRSPFPIVHTGQGTFAVAWRQLTTSPITEQSLSAR